jgi:hypothetical protein
MKERIVYDEVLGFLRVCDKHGAYWEGGNWFCPRCRIEETQKQIEQMQAYIESIRAKMTALMMAVPFRRMGDLETQKRNLKKLNEQTVIHRFE